MEKNIIFKVNLKIKKRLDELFHSLTEKVDEKTKNESYKIFNKMYKSLDIFDTISFERHLTRFINYLFPLEMNESERFKKAKHTMKQNIAEVFNNYNILKVKTLNEMKKDSIYEKYYIQRALNDFEKSEIEQKSIKECHDVLKKMNERTEQVKYDNDVHKHLNEKRQRMFQKGV